jgi:hypothetical protein
MDGNTKDSQQRSYRSFIILSNLKQNVKEMSRQFLKKSIRFIFRLLYNLSDFFNTNQDFKNCGNKKYF